MSPRLRAYVAVVWFAAAALLAWQWPAVAGREWAHILAWTAICLLTETLWSATLSGTATWSLSATVGLSSAVVWGTGAGMWVSSLSTLVADRFVLKKSWLRTSFNAAQVAIATAAAGLAFDALGGHRALVRSGSAFAFERAHAWPALLAFVALAVVYFAFNRLLVSRAVSWADGRRWWATLREDWLYTARLEMDGASFLLVPLMVVAHASLGYAGVLLFFAPLFMLYQSDRRYIELRRAEQVNLRNARFAAKGELAAGIGHELNNQLVAISARAQMLLRDAERQAFDDSPRHAQIILDQSRRMGVLAKGLMDYTRHQVKLEPTDLNALLASTVEFVRGDRRFRGVEWEVTLDPSLPLLDADAGQLQGVFINLFVNAADAMASQDTPRRITVTSRLDARHRHAAFVVADSGPGIAKEHLARMFEFMFTTKADGHGFGLATSQRTVESHGGSLRVESEPGHGATFHIDLPLPAVGGRR